MKTWFTCKVKYQKQDDQGRIKNVNEAYLTDALSFTEAEARIYEEMGQRVMGEFIVTSITKSKIVDVFEYPAGDVFYQVKITYLITDADSGKEKKVSNIMIIHAENVSQAYDRIHEALNNMLTTFAVPEIKESPIIEVFHHTSEEKIPDNFTPISEVAPDQEEEDEQDI